MTKINSVILSNYNTRLYDATKVASKVYPTILQAIADQANQKINSLIEIEGNGYKVNSLTSQHKDYRYIYGEFSIADTEEIITDNTSYPPEEFANQYALTTDTNIKYKSNGIVWEKSSGSTIQEINIDFTNTTQDSLSAAYRFIKEYGRIIRGVDTISPEQQILIRQYSLNGAIYTRTNTYDEFGNILISTFENQEKTYNIQRIRTYLPDGQIDTEIYQTIPAHSPPPAPPPNQEGQP